MKMTTGGYLNIPNDQTSDLLLNLLYLMTSGADHLTGNLEPWELVYWSSSTNLQWEELQTTSSCIVSFYSWKREWIQWSLTWSFQSQTPSPRCSLKPDNSWQPEGWKKGESSDNKVEKMERQWTLLDKLLRDSLVFFWLFPSEVSRANQWLPSNHSICPTDFMSSFTKSMNLLYGLPLAPLPQHLLIYSLPSVASLALSKYHVLSLRYSFLIPILVTPMKCAMMFPLIEIIHVSVGLRDTPANAMLEG